MCRTQVKPLTWVGMRMPWASGPYSLWQQVQYKSYMNGSECPEVSSALIRICSGTVSWRCQGDKWWKLGRERWQWIMFKDNNVKLISYAASPPSHFPPALLLTFFCFLLACISMKKVTKGTCNCGIQSIESSRVVFCIPSGMLLVWEGCWCCSDLKNILPVCQEQRQEMFCISDAF